MSYDLKRCLPPKLLNNLPYVIEEKNIFSPICFAYLELKKGDDVELFKYYYSENKNQMVVDAKNYKTKLKSFEKICERVRLCLPENTHIAVPRSPIEIAKELYNKLSHYDIGQEDAMITVVQIVGYSTAIDLNELEKFSSHFKYNLKFYRKQL